MTDIQTPVPVVASAAAETSPSSRRRRNSVLYQCLWGDTRSRLATCFLILLAGLALLAPLTARYSPSAQDFEPFNGISWQHWLGTDDLGRDVWARLVHGARASMTAAFIAVSLALAIGVPVGLLAGLRGGWVDAVLMRIADTLLSFPGIVIAIGITAVLGPGLVHSMTAVGIVFSPSIARVTRGQVLVVKERVYVDAAVTFGSPSWRTALRHVVPNCMQPVIIQTTFMLGLAVIAEASLSFVGLGVQYPDPSFGIMLQRAAQFISSNPAGVYPPGLAIALTVLAFNTLGDSLRDALDPVASTRRRLKGSSPRVLGRKGTRRARPRAGRLARTQKRAEAPTRSAPLT
ncbi:ABC transporter permease [Streptomyces sp. JH14]|uniref:ABC transporter permease n=1 Tax=Streptomyces sp. JH14 TaxID=2793630 RepID=UPI0023F8FBDF|nr:ABC transporter permease [Streptomyces sp. JH14]MDF6046144.1 ABC transporter permease [Streptomyces sp. JH14]